MNLILNSLNNFTILCFNNNSEALYNNMTNYRFKNNINCSHICFFKSKKIILESKKCILNCTDSDDKYEYNNMCYNSCPNGTYPSSNSFLCLKENNNKIIETEIINSSYLLENETKENNYPIKEDNITYNNNLLPNWNLDVFF